MILMCICKKNKKDECYLCYVDCKFCKLTTLENLGEVDKDVSIKGTLITATD